MPAPLQITPGDVVQMRKPHPCGGDIWRVLRVGADIRIRCETCGRTLMLPRSTFERRLKRFVQRADPLPTRESAPQDEPLAE